MTRPQALAELAEAHTTLTRVLLAIEDVQPISRRSVCLHRALAELGLAVDALHHEGQALPDHPAR